jgi:cell division protein FtsN
MMRTERRKFPRMRAAGLTYVDIEPDNGGMLLNISEGGLCFHTAIPVQRNASLRFSFSQCNERIEADGILVWTDDTGRRGGLRFTNMHAERREAIQNFILQHAGSVILDEMPAPLAARPRVAAPVSAIQWEREPARSATALMEVPSPGLQPAPAIQPAQGMQPVPVMQPKRILTGFSGGLAAGILVSAFVATMFFLQSHRRELGETIIHVGERLGGRTLTHAAAPEPATLSQAPRVQAPAMRTTLPPQAASATLTPVREALRSQPQPAALAAKPEAKGIEAAPAATPQVKSTEATPAPPPRVSPAPVPAASASIVEPAVKRSSTPLPSLRPVIPEARMTDSNPGALRDPAPPTEAEVAPPPGILVEPTKTVGEPTAAEKFLEVGKFNEKEWADKTSDKLAQLGFPAEIIQKTRLWKKSFQVLVGPYNDETDVESVHKSLVNSGFSARSFERGTREFRLPPALKIAGSRMPAGDCVISWESYLPAAFVKFVANSKGFSVTVEGKWVPRNVKYHEDAVVYTKNPDGSRNLVELRFSGMKQALVLGGS